MKKWIFCLIAMMIGTQAFAYTLSGPMTLGRHGEPYEKEGITWQPVICERTGTQFAGVMPGSPSSVFSSNSPWLTIQSNYHGTRYRILAAIEKSKTPRTGKEFNEKVMAMLPQPAEIYPFTPEGVKAKHSAAFRVEEKGNPPMWGRAYFVKGRFYVIVAQGEDDSLADEFFAKFKPGTKT